MFETGVYPEQWCKGIITTIFKRGDKNDISNYREITQIAKNYSFVIKNQINRWAENEKVFTLALENRNTSDFVLILTIYKTS